MYSIKVIYIPFYQLYDITTECCPGTIILSNTTFWNNLYVLSTISGPLPSGTVKSQNLVENSSQLTTHVQKEQTQACTRRQCEDVTFCVIGLWNLLMTTDALDLLQGHFLLGHSTLCPPRPSLEAESRWAVPTKEKMTEKTSWTQFTGTRKRDCEMLVRSPQWKHLGFETNPDSDFALILTPACMI